MSIAQQIGANILDLKAGVDDVLAGLTKVLPPASNYARYDLAIRRGINRQRPRSHPHRRIPGDHRPPCLPSRTGVDDDCPVTLRWPSPTFVFMWVFGGTINLMSMGAWRRDRVGHDDAVVVVENIHRRCGEAGGSVSDSVAAALAPLIQLDV